MACPRHCASVFEPCLKELPAFVLPQVGDQSDFVTAIGRALQEFGPPLGASLPEHHFAFFCDKLGGGFGRRFGDAVARCRKIGEAGSQQLLLDAHAVRGLLLAFPASGGRRSPSPFPSPFLSCQSLSTSPVPRVFSACGAAPFQGADACVPLDYQR